MKYSTRYSLSHFLAAGLLVYIITISRTAQSQECVLFTNSDLESLLSSTLTSDPNTVCLAGGTLRSRYRLASVYVTYDGQQRQLDLRCLSSGQWSVVSNGNATADASTALRRDCGVCTRASNDPTYDNVTHCIPCLDSCKGLQQCTTEVFGPDDCCNYYNMNNTCVLECLAGNGADDSTNFTCTDPCSSNPCSNNGTCIPEVASGISFSCSCVGSWEGPICDSCSIADCSVCSQINDICSECNNGFHKLSSGACACSLMCQNGGVLNGSQCRCNCSPGYSGSTCGVACMVENCQTCSPSSGAVCDACAEGYLKKEDEKTCSSGKFIGPLSLGAFIGIVVGGGVTLLLLSVFIVMCYCYYRKSGSSGVV